MNFKDYQEKSRLTAIYPDLDHNYIYPVLGLAGEAGEVAEKIKKIIRDHQGLISDHHRVELKKELGDVLWYVAQLASELKLDLDDVAFSNIVKLHSRWERDMLNGSGDNR